MKNIILQKTLHAQSIARELSMHDIYLLSKIESSSLYKAPTWDYERALRYIYEIEGKILEAGFFSHYLNGQHIKNVIELPISYGCPIACKHCASGAINSSKTLTADNLLSMFEHISSENNIPSNSKILITYSGIGEGALHKKTLLTASQKIYNKNSGAYFNISSVGFDPTFIDFSEKFEKSAPLNNIQISYLHNDIEKITKIIPTAKKIGIDVAALISRIKERNCTKVRFNYVMINNYNDDPDTWIKFILLTNEIKNKIRVRISRLNETEISKKNRITPPRDHKLDEFLAILISLGYDAHKFTADNNNNMNCGQLSWNYSTNNPSP
jgi:adenine C2-methylase RlmN of 23S rRNA A2503 and tRNA A37